MAEGVAERSEVGAGVRALAAVTLLAVLSPVVQNFRAQPRDGFPLSYYPMFTNERHGHTTIYHAIGVRSDGTTLDLDHGLASRGGMNQARHQMRRFVRDGRSAELAEKVARRARRRGIVAAEQLVAIETVRDSYDFDRFFAGDLEPSRRRIYHRLELREGQR